MLSITDLKTGTKIEYKNEPYEVIRAEHSKVGRGGAVLRTKLKNLITSSVLEIKFKEGDKFEKPDLESKSCLFMYKENQNYYFMDNETYDQFSLSENILQDKKMYLIENTSVKILYYNNKPTNIDLPIKINLKVVKAPPGVKGDTAEGGTKEVEVETGLKVTVPLFIKEGDVIKVDTRNGKYVERV
jgi:elongation factor P